MAELSGWASLPDGLVGWLSDGQTALGRTGRGGGKGISEVFRFEGKFNYDTTSPFQFQFHRRRRTNSSRIPKSGIALTLLSRKKYAGYSLHRTWRVRSGRGRRGAIWPLIHSEVGSCARPQWAAQGGGERAKERERERETQAQKGEERREASKKGRREEERMEDMVVLC